MANYDNAFGYTMDTNYWEVYTTKPHVVWLTLVASVISDFLPAQTLWGSIMLALPHSIDSPFYSHGSA